jgi:dTDP-glucose pyrophosphorylase/CBS domain-containing protein
MKRHNRSKHEQADVPPLFETNEPLRQPQGTIIVGAGNPCRDIIRLLAENPQFQCLGILDPDLSLRGDFIDDIPVLGWLGHIPPHARCAVIGCPRRKHHFDRKSVYHILVRQGLALPVMRALSSAHAQDVVLPAGTTLLPQSRIENGASIGINCLLEKQSVVERCAALPEHSVLTEKQHHRCGDPRDAAPGTRELHAILATADESLQRIVERINWANMEIILVVDKNQALIGTITDGDIRRGLLAGIDFQQPAAIIMNKAPTTVPLGTPREKMLQIMREKSIRHLPVVDRFNRPVILERMETILDQISGSDAIVMAGGLGTRLRPLTNDTPKPLLPVGNRPILDHILGGLKNAGIGDVVLSVNYRGDQIRKHVRDGAAHDLSVNYVSEKQRLGTAGALSLLTPRPQRPFLVMNGDLLTNLNFAKLLHFQRENNYAMVMCVRQYKIQVPYGVVDIQQDGTITGLREKPTHEHFINAGIYVLKPECLDYIPEKTFFDMTDLFQALVQNGHSVGAFPIMEYWRDIGRPEDLKAASAEQMNVLGAASPGTIQNHIPTEVLV